MTTETMAETKTDVLGDLRAARDSLSTRRAFGESYDREGVTVIPVARVSGGGGGGGGENPESDDDGGGGGFGTGFGMGVQPVGVYEIRDGAVEWKPTVDVNRLVKGGMVLAGIVSVCVTLVLLNRDT